MNGERGGRSAGVGGSGGEEGTERRPARRLVSLEGWREVGRRWEGQKSAGGFRARPEGPAGPGRPEFFLHVFIIFLLTRTA